MQARYLFLLRFIIAITDLTIIISSFFVGFYLTFDNINEVGKAVFNHTLFTSIIIWFLTTSLLGLYTGKSLKLEHVYSASWKSLILHFFLFACYLSISNNFEFPKFFISVFYTLVVLGLLLSRFLGTAFESIIKRNFNVKKSVAILGNNKGGMRLANYFEDQKDVNFVGFLGNENFYVDPSGALIKTAEKQFRAAANSKINEVFVSLAPEQMGDVSYLLKEAEQHCIRLKFVPDFSNQFDSFNMDHMDSFPILTARVEPLQEMKNSFKKRFFDVIFSSLVIVFILSWLYPILAIIIKLLSSGPVLYKQLRSGRDNKPFYCYKFRSMYTTSNDEKVQAVRNDNRITAIGRFMRKTSLDEFPQFINVLLGNMSVSGPRPHMLEHTEKYCKIIDQYMVRQFLKPGITGWAQIKGFRGETKETYLMEKRVEHDIWYMEHWSTMLDVRIIFMTVINVILGEENAY
jgi:putative colanic acid biosynthesis UDP-glucose lipid carrier transferase